jgi:hypothetical protein
MIIAHYAHRLPADYDLDIIRTRIQRNAPIWDALPDLHFKAVLLREKGKHGAVSNSYSSLYLWRQEAALREFLTGGRFRVVTESFGRPAIDIRLPIDARRGPAREAKLARIEEEAVPLDVDPTEFLVEEAGRNRALAHRPEIVAAVTAIDTRDWRILRAVLTDGPTTALPGGTSYQVAHLARPHFDELP